MPLDFAISKDFRKLLAFGSGVGIEIGATRSRSRGDAGAAQQDPGAGPPDHRKLCRAAGGRVGRRVRALPEGVGRGTPQRHRAAAAPRSDRAPDRAARCRRQGYRRRHPLPAGYACTPTATKTWCGAGRRSPSAACWWASRCAAPSSAMSLSLSRPVSRCAASRFPPRRYMPPSA